MPWRRVETALAALPSDAAARVALRAARRAMPAAVADAGHYGPEAFDWLNALDRAAAVAENGHAGFRLAAAADVARCVAAALARASQLKGPGPNREAAELAAAAVALALDAARTPARAATLAMQAARAACAMIGDGDPTPDVLADLVDGGIGPLWRGGEPAGSVAAWAALAASGRTGPVV